MRRVLMFLIAGTLGLSAALFAWGAYSGFTTFKYLGKWVAADSVLLNLGVFLIAIVVAMGFGISELMGSSCASPRAFWIDDISSVDICMPAPEIIQAQQAITTTMSTTTVTMRSCLSRRSIASAPRILSIHPFQ